MPLRLLDFCLRFHLPYPHLNDFQLQLILLKGTRPLGARLSRKTLLRRSGARFTNDFVQPPTLKDEFSIFIVGFGLVPRHARSLSLCSLRAVIPVVS